jgi:malate dehydrogenase
MPVTAIIGAGPLGGALAFKLASRDRMREIRLIDAAGGIAAGKALDIQQSAPIDPFGTRLIGTDDLSLAFDAAVIVLADAASGSAGELTGDSALPILKRLADLARDAVIVCAGATQSGLIESGVCELGIPRRRIVGSAPEAVLGALRAHIALELDGSPSDVSVSLVGVPPEGLIPQWSSAVYGSSALAARLAPHELARLNARLPRIWPPGSYALASAAARVSEAAARGSRRDFCCFVALDGEFGVRNRAAAMPARLGLPGVIRLAVPTLSARERVLVENALARRP